MGGVGVIGGVWRCGEADALGVVERLVPLVTLEALVPQEPLGQQVVLDPLGQLVPQEPLGQRVALVPLGQQDPQELGDSRGCPAPWDQEVPMGQQAR